MAQVFPNEFCKFFSKFSTLFWTFFPLAGPILESKGMRAVFQQKGKKGQKNVRKWQNI